jgi:hypothetical protein
MPEDVLRFDVGLDDILDPLIEKYRGGERTWRSDWIAQNCAVLSQAGQLQLSTVATVFLQVFCAATGQRFSYGVHVDLAELSRPTLPETLDKYVRDAFVWMRNARAQATMATMKEVTQKPPAGPIRLLGPNGHPTS